MYYIEKGESLLDERYKAFELAKNKSMGNEARWAVVFSVNLQQYFVQFLEPSEKNYHLYSSPGGELDLIRVYEAGKYRPASLIHNTVIIAND